MAPKAAVRRCLQVIQAECLSLPAMVDRFNIGGVPTLSSKGRWQKGVIGKLLSTPHDALEDEKGGG
jgi:hypothetical protein